MIRRLLRRLLPAPARGGELPAYRPSQGEQMVVLSPGRRLDDPDEAEAMGMTATARRLRREGQG
ncbi:hypothetical protein ACFU5D_16295 [Streptomyces anthocyanicus]|uniref:hypothetical protein n=1 Tax=Streptomyces anthocyanicus TaxID=68174 RepID=UPI00368DC986